MGNFIEQVSISKRGRRNILRSLVLCLLAYFLVRSFFVEPFKIPSSSMEPTLRIGDHIIVSKFSYSWFVPGTSYEFLRFGTPKRGDVVIFLFPKDPSLHYVKRVVGLPGDKIETQRGSIKINGEDVTSQLIEDPIQVSAITGKSIFDGIVRREQLGPEHFILQRKHARALIDPPPMMEIVPPDHFFVLGDNRDDSYDSRSWGPVPRANLRGKAQLIWVSIDANKSLRDGVRWERLFRWLH